MPPSATLIKGSIEKALLASTDPVFREKDKDGNSTGDLPDNMKVMVKCIAQGVYDSLSDWQSAATVNGGVCTPSGPITGGTITDAPTP
jgi:hypothetical protein